MTNPSVAERNGSEPGTALAPITGPVSNLPAVQQTQRMVQLLRPIADATVLVQAQAEARKFIATALEPGKDFGKTPGVEKNSLYKPGAEKFNKAYGLVERFEVLEKEIDHDREIQWTKRKKDWSGPRGSRRFKVVVENGVSYGLYRYVIMCELVDIATGEVRGRCIGSASTLESKYIDRPRDLENTIIKMAEKRAYVGASLFAHALSDEFTQDVEDIGVEAAEQERQPVEEEHGEPAPAIGTVPWAKDYVLPDAVQLKFGNKKTAGELDLVQLTALDRFCTKQIALKPESIAIREMQKVVSVLIEWHEDQAAFTDDDKTTPAPAEAGAPTPAASAAGAGAGPTT